MKTLARFNAVGLAGLVVQLSLLNALVRGLSLNYLAATAIAVEAAVLHNFWWHWKWTWGARRAPAASSLARFQFTTGTFSLAGNLFGMRLLAGWLHVDPVAANLATVAALYVLNFALADRFVFRVR